MVGQSRHCAISKYGRKGLVLVGAEVGATALDNPMRAAGMTAGAIPRDVKAADLARAFELASRLVHSRSHASGLYPAQWSALRYFRTSAGQYRTSAALARYQGLAFGPVARTVRTLIERGFLRKAGSAGRGRAEIVELTAAGDAMLAEDPLRPLVEAMEDLDADARAAFGAVLEAVLTALASAGGAGAGAVGDAGAAQFPQK